MKKTGGRLPFQSFIARSVCIAHAIFDATQGADLVIIEQSREIKSIARVPSQNGPTIGLYVLKLVHELTYAMTMIASDPPITVGVYGHARAHISTANSGLESEYGTPLLFTHFFLDVVNEDPTLSQRHFLGIAAQAIGEGLVPADGIIEVSIFDVLEPEKRYITREGGKGLKIAKAFFPLTPATPATPATVKPDPAISRELRRPAPPK